MSNVVDSIINLVREFIDNTRDLNITLHDDKDYFKENNLEMLELSNDKKNVLNNKLKSIYEALAINPNIAIYSGNIFDKLLSFAKSITDSRLILKNLVTTMQDESNITIDLMQINRNVVSSNLSYVRDIVGEITQNTHSSKSNVYDGRGIIR